MMGGDLGGAMDNDEIEDDGSFFGGGSHAAFATVTRPNRSEALQVRVFSAIATNLPETRL